VPLKELNSVQSENGKKDCSKKSGRLQIERKNSGISKKQQALQTFNVFPENVASESEAERPVVVKVASHGQLWARNQVRCAQPQSFEHHHDMDVASTTASFAQFQSMSLGFTLSKPSERYA